MVPALPQISISSMTILYIAHITSKCEYHRHDYVLVSQECFDENYDNIVFRTAWITNPPKRLQVLVSCPQSVTLHRFRMLLHFQSNVKLHGGVK